MKSEKEIQDKLEFIKNNLTISKPRSDEEYKNGLCSLLEWVLS